MYRRVKIKNTLQFFGLYRFILKKKYTEHGCKKGIKFFRDKRKKKLK